MKTTRNITIAAAAKAAFVALAALMAMGMASCSSAEDEPVASPYGEGATVTDAQITFTYTVPQELFAYSEINVAYNNNAGTDAKWEPMLDNRFTVTYNINKFPMMTPVVFIYDKTNRPASGVQVDWDITMDVEVTMTVGGQKVTQTHTETYKMEGDLDAAITALQKNVVERTYGVKVAKNGVVKFIK